MRIVSSIDRMLGLISTRVTCIYSTVYTGIYTVYMLVTSYPRHYVGIGSSYARRIRFENAYGVRNQFKVLN